MSLNPALNDLLKQVRVLRESKGLSSNDLEKRLILGPGWIEEFETGKTIPRLDIFIAILNALGAAVGDIDFSHSNKVRFTRNLFATQQGNDSEVAFPYGRYEAKYYLKNATTDEFNQVLLALRSGLIGSNGNDDPQVKANAVASAFLKAVSLWPSANPSDIWWFIIYRAFIDTFNHPASEARLNFDQSWKRTSGWALERVLVKHYSEMLGKQGIRARIESSETKVKLLSQIKTTNRVEADKADILLTTATKYGEKLFGVVHVKASFAERRTDDVPLSQELIQAGYFSPLWTMDCKGAPAANPFNKGELGTILNHGEDTRSAKRKDIEEDGYFSACFSYNANTQPTPADQKVAAKIYVCNFSNPNDEFFLQTVQARDEFVRKLD